MFTKKNSIWIIIISLIIAGGLFFIFLFILKALFLGLILGIAFYLISFIYLTKKKPESVHKLNNIKDKELKKIVNIAYEKIKEIKILSIKINNNVIKNKVNDILKLSEKILNDIERNPDKIKSNRQFLSYYLNAALKIIKQYIEISGKNIKDNEVEKVLVKTEKILELIKNSFEKHLSNLLKNDIMDLDVELSVLEKILKNEGML